MQGRDSHNIQLKFLNDKKEKFVQDPAKQNEIFQAINKLRRDHQHHLRMAEKFYDEKRKVKRLCRYKVDHEAIVMDYAKNLPVPNLTTNDIYIIMRQLTLASFNIHVLSNDGSFFFSYHETIAKEGCNEVCSFCIIIFSMYWIQK